MPDSSGFLFTKFPVVNPDEEGYKANSYIALFDVASNSEIKDILFNANMVEVKDTSLFSLIDVSSSESRYVISYLATSDDYWDAYYTETDLLKQGRPAWKKLYKSADKVMSDSPFYWETESILSQEKTIILIFLISILTTKN